MYFSRLFIILDGKDGNILSQVCWECGLHLNKYNNKMIEQSKSPKSLAYARVCRPASGKASLQEEQRKHNRNSTGTLFSQIVTQFAPNQQNYINELVSKHEKQTEEKTNAQYFHSRKKSYAGIELDNKDKHVVQKPREERETLSKSKQPPESFIQQVSTPKNSTIPLNTRNGSRNGSTAMIASLKKQCFLDNLNNYLQELTEAPQQHQKLTFNNVQKLSQTLKFGSGEGDSLKMASRLQQCQMKIKQLKLKSYYHEKELAKNAKKERKMKESLFQMLSQIKQLNAQLSYQKKQRKKLQKIIDSFDIRRAKPERKTIGKLHHLNLEELSNDNTENEFQRDLEESVRDFMKRSVDKKAMTSKLYGQRRRGGLDEQKIERLFRSNYNSDCSDD